jgi:hypothetical protein
MILPSFGISKFAQSGHFSLRRGTHSGCEVALGLKTREDQFRLLSSCPLIPEPGKQCEQVLALTGFGLAEDQVRQLIIGVSSGEPVGRATLELAIGQPQPNAAVANALLAGRRHAAM